MASVDLDDAYYSIPFSKAVQEYLKFRKRNEVYRFVFLQWVIHLPSNIQKTAQTSFCSPATARPLVLLYKDDFLLTRPIYDECARLMSQPLLHCLTPLGLLYTQLSQL